MKTIRITKQFNFEMAHALHNYDGNCKNLHGHSYKLFVTIKGKPIEDINSPKNGMVLDFGELKKIINTEIIDIFDHAVVLNKIQKNVEFESLQMFTKTIYTDFQPTCENLIVHFAEKIIACLPSFVVLQNLRLYETANSYAEWFADDNN